MTAQPLRRCPTCGRSLSDDDRQAMGLRNGEVLAAMCPGKIGPSDIDHVLHNGRTGEGTLERLAFLEYKAGNVTPGYGQWLLHRSLRGHWQSDDGRQLDIQVRVLPQFPPDPVSVLRPTVDWLWPALHPALFSR